MSITRELKCPQCHSGIIVRNGKKSNGPQNYLCKDCGRQFISEHEKTYRGCLSGIAGFVKIMLVRGVSIRDSSTILKISVTKVLKTLTSGIYAVQPKKKHYDCLEIDEFWTYVREKKNKVRLIYAYHQKSGEITAYGWGKRDLKTARKLGKRLKRLEITCDTIASDDWDSFLAAFADDNRLIGKAYTVGIEGNNCRFRRRIRRAFRRTGCFSKKLFNHWKAFNMAFHYLNYGFV